MSDSPQDADPPVDLEKTLTEPPPGPLAPAQLELELIKEAVTSGLITSAQADQIRHDCESAVTLQGVGSGISTGISGAAGEAAADQTVSLMVTKGLITKEAGQDLRDKVEGEFIPGYRLEGELGRGAMGVVYKAVQKKLDRRVALKVINPNLSNDTSYVQRFKLEALALAKLNHPNIVQVYDYGEASGKIFLALEFVNGQDCAEFMKSEGGSLSEAASLGIIRDSALGLSHAHQHGIIHRDIKPANLLITKVAQDATGAMAVTKVTDLGLARETEKTEGQADLTQAGSILGSPAYMAPEQTYGEPADHRSDIYALGASLYHMLTGKLPFASKHVVDVLVKKRTEFLPNPQTVVPSVSDGLVLLLDRMLAKPPEERYQTYAELLADLDAVIKGEAPKTPPVHPDFTSLRDVSSSTATREIPASQAKTHAAAPAQDSPPAQDPGNGESNEGSARGAVFVLVTIVALAGLGVWNASQTRVTPTPPETGATGSTPPTATTPTASLGNTLDALSKLDGEGILSQGKELDAIKAEIAALPAVDRRALKLRFNGLINKALNDSRGAVVKRLTASHKAGDYQVLKSGVANMRWAYGLLDAELPGDVSTLAKQSDAADTGGAGAKERAVWAKLQETSDPLAILALSADFKTAFSAFSPVLAEVATLRSTAKSDAPQIKVNVLPAEATLTLDGKATAHPWTGRLPLGEHVLLAEAKGFLPMKQVTRVEGRAQFTLRLGPAPKGLRQDPGLQLPLWRGSARFLQDFRQSGMWRPRTDQAGVEGDAKGGKIATLSRDLKKTLKKGPIRRAEGWSLDWEQVPDPNAAGEAQGSSTVAVSTHLVVGDETVVIGFKNGRAYTGVLQEGALVVCYEQASDFPRHCRMDWDGGVVSLYADDALLWTFRPKATAFDRAEFHVENGRALFREMLVIRLQLVD